LARKCQVWGSDPNAAHLGHLSLLNAVLPRIACVHRFYLARIPPVTPPFGQYQHRERLSKVEPSLVLLSRGGRLGCALEEVADLGQPAVEAHSHGGNPRDPRGAREFDADDVVAEQAAQDLLAYAVRLLAPKRLLCASLLRLDVVESHLDLPAQRVQ